MKNKLLLFLFFISLTALAQRPRQPLHGKIVADSLDTANVSVFNITSNIGAVTDDDGEYTLYARPTDTLYFTSISFRSLYLELKPEHFSQGTFVVKLDINITVLDEVVVTPNPLTGDLDKDSKNANVLAISSQFAGLAKPKYPVSKQAVNTAMPQTESQLKGIDFMEIGKLLFGKRKKKIDAEKEYQKGKSFIQSVKERYTHHFFTQTLKIPHKEIGLFLSFCDKGAETAYLLDPKNEFQLTDYLVTKSAEYLKKEE